MGKRLGKRRPKLLLQRANFDRFSDVVFACRSEIEVLQIMRCIIVEIRGVL